MRPGTFVTLGLIAACAAAAIAARLHFAEPRPTPPRPPPVATGAPVAAPPAAVTASTPDATERDRLRREIAQVQAQARKLENPARPAPLATADGPWSNRGRRSPEDTIATVLWSIAQGDTRVLAESCAFDDDARRAAAEFHAALPESSRAAFAGPADLVATMMAARTGVAYRDFVVTPQAPTASGDVPLSVQLLGARTPRTIQLTVRPGPGGWQLLVPAPVIIGYRHLLIGSAAP